MAYKINADKCVACGACASECPVGAISEAGDKYVINADACIDCGTCESTCPVGAPAAE
ncbi:MAG: 4Fe-4S binding protein [Clostridia bacterium]|nr:4Fe-4S binding protein [Clostridia bacterium]MDY3785616.1 4Fe-4S binding protein [Eubacteriales bacterium]